MKRRFLTLLLLGCAMAWADDDLVSAAFRADLHAVKRALTEGADVNQANRYGVTPLSLACREGNLDMVRQLLDAGANPNVARRTGETPLMSAARCGAVEVVHLLVERGAWLDAREAHGQTAMMWAAAEGHAGIVRYLLRRGAESMRPLRSGFTPFLFAVRQGHREVVKVFLKDEIDVNAVTHPEKPGGKHLRKGTAALILAVENGHFDLACDLLEAGADPNDERSGYTPLHALTWVRKSVKGDGDDGIPTPEGSGTLDSLKFVDVLVSHGAEVNRQLRHGRGGGGRLHRQGATAFLLACQTADLPLLKKLLACGADASLSNVEGSLPILAAAGLGTIAPGEEAARIPDSLEVVKFLLSQGADLNVKDKRGETVMHAAAYKAAPEMMRLLDQAGADISFWNAPNKFGNTPLRITQGFRPGNFRPIAYSEKALTEIMQAHGVDTPPAPKRRK